MVIESPLQPFRLLEFSGAAGQLPGDLKVSYQPVITTSNTEIYYGAWESPHGQRIDVAVKEFRARPARNIHSDSQTLRKRMDKVRTFELLYKSLSHPLLYSASNEK